MLDSARAMAVGGKIPPPLEDSPKCPRCSLVGICLPDEVTFLKGSRHVVKPDDVRRMAPARDDALPMYVTTQGGVVGKSGDNLTVSVKREVVARARFLDVSSLSIFGNTQVTSQATRELLTGQYPSATSPYGGWLKGVTWSMGHKNVELADSPVPRSWRQPHVLSIARDIVVGQTTQQ